LVDHVIVFVVAFRTPPAVIAVGVCHPFPGVVVALSGYRLVRVIVVDDMFE